MRALLQLTALALACCALAQQAVPPAQPPATPQKPPEPEIKVSVDGRPVRFPTGRPKTITGRILVPLRGVFQEIGAYVEYDPATRKVMARMGNSEIELTIGDQLARKNGAEIMLDVPPAIHEGATMVPLRFLAEALGARVEYDNATKSVAIYTADYDEPAR